QSILTCTAATAERHSDIRTCEPVPLSSESLLLGQQSGSESGQHINLGALSLLREKGTCPAEADHASKSTACQLNRVAPVHRIALVRQRHPHALSLMPNKYPAIAPKIPIAAVKSTSHPLPLPPLAIAPCNKSRPFPI